jgi:hypothetical protein
MQHSPHCAKGEKCQPWGGQHSGGGGVESRQKEEGRNYRGAAKGNQGEGAGQKKSTKRGIYRGGIKESAAVGSEGGGDCSGE